MTMHPPTLRSILAPIGLGGATDAVLETAAELAIHPDAELHLMHAVDTPTLPFRAAQTAVEFQSQLHEARRALNDLVRTKLDPEHEPATIDVRAEPPARAILERAAEVEADLIVIGPNRRRGIGPALLGTTADRVIRSAAAPVLVVREPLRLPIERILAPIDLSEPARGAVDAALRWAAGFGAPSGAAAGRTRVRVLHTAPEGFRQWLPEVDLVEMYPSLAHEAEAARERTGVGGRVEIEPELVWADAPDERICAEAQEWGADLIVLGTHGHNALGRALIGSTTSGVARNAPCAVLLVPPALWLRGTVEAGEEESAAAV
jgi:nucleotide-binding universal stress UspA family protein